MNKLKALVTLIKTTTKAKVIAGTVAVAVVGTGVASTVAIVNHNNEVKQQEIQASNTKIKLKDNVKTRETTDKTSETKNDTKPSETKPTTTPTVTASTDTTALDNAKNAVGNRLAELQKGLSKLGYKVDADGAFGQTTYDSLIRFQREHGLTADGLAGSATFSKLNALAYPTTASTSSGNTSSTSSGNVSTATTQPDYPTGWVTSDPYINGMSHRPNIDYEQKLMSDYDVVMEEFSSNKIGVDEVISKISTLTEKFNDTECIVTSLPSSLIVRKETFTDKIIVRQAARGCSSDYCSAKIWYDASTRTYTSYVIGTAIQVQ